MQGLTTTTIFRVLAASGLVALFLMARHSSTEATVLGRWSSRYAFLLAFVTIATFLTALLINTSLRARIFRQNAVPLSKRHAWAMMAAGLAILPVLHMLVRSILASHEDRVGSLVVSLLLSAMAAILLLLMWRQGITSFLVSLQHPWLLVAVIFGSQLVMSFLFQGQIPAIDTIDETRVIGNAIRQFHFPDRFILLDARRNSDTWFYIQGIWWFSGAWMNLFGAGLLQARFFNLIVAWIALPFLYLTARKLYNFPAALITVIFGIMLPMHFVTARGDVWVATATCIALYCHVHARDPVSRRPHLLSFLCGLVAVSAVDGHPYGVFFAVVLVLLRLSILLPALRTGLDRKEAREFLLFISGCLVYGIIWIGYHLFLPGVQLAELANLLQGAWNRETRLGEVRYGTGPTVLNLLKYVQLMLYLHPAFFVLSVPASLFALRRWRSTDGPVLFVTTGSLVLVFLFLAHFNAHYLIFWLPPLCLWSGVWLSGTFFPGRALQHQEKQLSFGALYILIAFLILNMLYINDSSNINSSLNEHWKVMEEAGREINKVLPDIDILVAGTTEVYSGMMQRLNFAASCGFTLDRPEYWPLPAPQAIIYTPGWDPGCDRLPDWLIDHNFQPARCFPVPGFGDGVAILYLEPELMPPERAIDCTPLDLAWLEGT